MLKNNLSGNIIIVSSKSFSTICFLISDSPLPASPVNKGDPFSISNITFENVQFIDSKIDQLNSLRQPNEEHIHFYMKGNIFSKNTTFSNMIIHLDYDTNGVKYFSDIKIDSVRFVDTFFKSSGRVYFGSLYSSVFYNCDFFDDGIKIFNSIFVHCSFNSSDVFNKINSGENEFSGVIDLMVPEKTPLCLSTIENSISLKNVISDNAIVLPCDLNLVTISSLAT